MTARNTKPLTATQAADRISALLKTRESRIVVAREKAADEAEQDVRQRDTAETDRIMARVPESERGRVAAVLLALGHEACGLEVETGNDVSDPAPRGTTPYVPGPAARAAERGSR